MRKIIADNSSDRPSLVSALRSASYRHRRASYRYRSASDRQTDGRTDGQAVAPIREKLRQKVEADCILDPRMSIYNSQGWTLCRPLTQTSFPSLPSQIIRKSTNNSSKQWQSQAPCRMFRNILSSFFWCPLCRVNVSTHPLFFCCFFFYYFLLLCFLRAQSCTPLPSLYIHVA